MTHLFCEARGHTGSHELKAPIGSPLKLEVYFSHHSPLSLGIRQGAHWLLSPHPAQGTRLPI